MKYSVDPVVLARIHLWIHPNGDRGWHNGAINTCRHGPAIVWNNGEADWIVNNKLHRLDGPALTFADGSVSYWVNDIRYNSYLEFIVAVDIYRNNITIDVDK